MRRFHGCTTLRASSSTAPRLRPALPLTGSRLGLPEDLVVHLTGDSAREGVLLAGVITAEQEQTASSSSAAVVGAVHLDAAAVPECGPRMRDREARRRQRLPD